MASKRGSTSFMIVILIAVMLIAGAVTTAVIVGDRSAASDPNSPDLFLVRKGSFDVTIPTSGELAAMRQVEIRNMMEEQGVIMEIVPEGTYVAEGTVLLKLNDEALREEIQDETENVNDAQNRYDNAVSSLSITKKDRESQLAGADLKIRLADLALKAWKEGEEIAKRRELELGIETNEKDYIRAQERYDKSIELEAKQFISTDELKSDEISMIKAKAALERAKLDREVYEKYTYFQDQAQKESDLEQARDERDRIQEKMDAEVRSAESDLETANSQLKSRKDRLSLLEQQLEYTVITAPTEGLVVYASSLRQGRDGRNEGRPPQVGTEVRRNELVMVLPDTSQMVAEVKVNETRTGQIRPGQRVSVTSDARPDQSMTGRVLSVGVLAESGGWRDPNRRDYTVRARLDTAGVEGLKPSMRCNAVIYVDRVEDAVYVPVSAVGQKGKVSYVWIPDGAGFSQHEIKFGRSSELYVEVLEGLEPGDLVLLRQPRVDEIVSALDIPEEELMDPFAGEEGPFDEGADGGMPNFQPGGDGQGVMPEGFQPTPEQLEQFRRMRDGGGQQGGNTGGGGGGRGRGGPGGGRGRGGGGGGRNRGGDGGGGNSDNNAAGSESQAA